MLNTFADQYQRSEAERARDLAYLIEDMNEDATDHMMELVEGVEVENVVGYDTLDAELAELMESLDDTDDGYEEELQRIMEAGEDGITFDQMIGLDPIETEEE